MSDDIDIEKMRTIGIVGQPYGKPRLAPTEGVYFNSAKEFDKYAEERNLVTVDLKPPKRVSARKVYRYDETLKKMVEVL